MSAYTIASPLAHGFSQSIGSYASSARSMTTSALAPTCEGAPPSLRGATVSADLRLHTLSAPLPGPPSVGTSSGGGLLRAVEEKQRRIVYGPIHGEQEILGGPVGCRTVFAEAASSGSKAARRYRGFAVGEVHGRKMDLKKLPERRLGRKRPTRVC
jgi:hypothetical protein